MNLGQALAKLNEEALNLMVKKMTKATANAITDQVLNDPTTTTLSVFIDSELIGGFDMEDVVYSLVARLEDKYGIFTDEVFETQLGSSLELSW